MDITTGPAVVGSRRTRGLGTAERSVPPEVTDRPYSLKEHHKAVHNRAIIADWDWEEGESPEDYTAPEVRPWTNGDDGKGLISPTGEVKTWATNAMGDPHHDVVSAEHAFPYAAKLNIRPNGQAFIPSPDELHLFGMTREQAERHLLQEAPAHGITPNFGYTASAERPMTCPTCGDPLKGSYGTFCPRCDWSENDANLDSDPLSNPPDPTVDMHRGIQARIAPSHRWAKWLAAVEDLDSD